jgi:hypothetical protein
MNRMCCLVLVISVAACGDNLKATSDAHGASPDAPADAFVPTTPRAVVAAPPENFGPPPGILSDLDVATRTVTQNLGGGLVGDDPFLRMYNGTLYIINRSDGDNVTILDAGSMTYTNQIATGTGSNPQDVAVVGDKLYVPALGTAGVVVLSQSGGAMTGTIDLNAATGETDGKPDCVSAFVVGTDVYVACDLLDSNFKPKGNGKIVVIDSATDTVRTTITLPVPNPQNEFAVLPTGDLLIAAESFDTPTTGCIARITPGATPTSTCAIMNSDLGGTANHIDVQTGATPTVWAAVSSFDFTTATLHAWDVTTATLHAGSISSADEMINDVAACPDGTIVAADATMAAPGLRMFTGTTETTTAALPFGLPPGFGNGLVCYNP